MKKARKPGVVKRVRSLIRWTRIAYGVGLVVAVASVVGVVWLLARRLTSTGTTTSDLPPRRAASADSTPPPAPPQRARTRDELYEEARVQGIKGRSKMSKEELERAVGH